MNITLVLLTIVLSMSVNIKGEDKIPHPSFLINQFIKSDKWFPNETDEFQNQDETIQLQFRLPSPIRQGSWLNHQKQKGGRVSSVKDSKWKGLTRQQIREKFRVPEDVMEELSSSGYNLTDVPPVWRFIIGDENLSKKDTPLNQSNINELLSEFLNTYPTGNDINQESESESTTEINIVSTNIPEVSDLDENRYAPITSNDILDEEFPKKNSSFENDIIQSSFISVADQFSQEDDEVIHLSEKVNIDIATKITTDAVVTSVSTVTETATVIKFKTNSASTITTTVYKTAEFVSSTNFPISMIMNWPVKHTLLSTNSIRSTSNLITNVTRTPDLSVTTTMRIEFTITPTVTANSDTSLLEPTSIEFFLPVSVQNERNISGNDGNITADLTESTVNETELFTSNKDEIIEKEETVAVTKTVTSVDEVTMKLHDIVNSILNSSESGGNKANVEEEESAEFDYFKSDEEIEVTSKDPYKCRKEDVQYPQSITTEELKQKVGSVLLIDLRDPSDIQETGRLPWSYNLPIGELHNAFKLRLSEFRKKYGFPKPGVGKENVVLSYTKGRRVINAWNELQMYGYCKIRVYYPSFEGWKRSGGTLQPVFNSTESTATKREKKLDNEMLKERMAKLTTVNYKNINERILTKRRVMDENMLGIVESVDFEEDYHL